MQSFMAAHDRVELYLAVESVLQRGVFSEECWNRETTRVLVTAYGCGLDGSWIEWRKCRGGMPDFPYALTDFRHICEV